MREFSIVPGESPPTLDVFSNRNASGLDPIGPAKLLRRPSLASGTDDSPPSGVHRLRFFRHLALEVCEAGAAPASFFFPPVTATATPEGAGLTVAAS